MSGHVYHKSAPILLVGAGPAYPDKVSKTLPFVESAIAVDGGLSVFRALNLRPDLVLGDLDSAAADDLDWAGANIVHHTPDQNSTDLQKVLAAVSAPVIVGIGFLGGRLDHHMAALSALLQNKRPVVLVHEDEACFIAPRHFEMDLDAGDAVAFYPLKPCTVTTQGVAYPVQDAQMAPDGLISTSNKMVQRRLIIDVDDHALMTVVPYHRLGDLLAGLQKEPKYL
ncbi:MAG: thiamine diphosphokinase [Planktomarina sp.]